tara:strand:+ start:453 stop:608 length:156 start_codon:yes stop_codon:yes gene_type:complete
MGDIARNAGMNEYLVALLIGFSFIAGFWVGVDWYRRKIIEEEIVAQEARCK